MTNYGLTQTELNEIIAILSEYPEIESVTLFGSRAMGNFKKASDIDLVIKGKKIGLLLTSHLKGRFEEDTNIPYFFDVIDYNTLENTELKKHITEKGIVIYKKKNHTAWHWIFLSIFIIAIDQLSKYLVLQNMIMHQVIKIMPFLNIMLSINAGAAFSFLSNASGWQIYLLSAISVTISVALIIWLCRLPREEWWMAAPISLVLGGALGNLIDRVHYGYVVDFIDFHIGTWHYATFNLADSAVCIGAIWLIVRLMYESITRQS